MNQDVKYDLTANLTGTGDRSVHEVKRSFTQWCYIDTDQQVFYRLVGWGLTALLTHRCFTPASVKAH